MDFKERILGEFPALQTESDFSFARHTTIGCGGRADLCAYPDSAETACALISFLRKEKIPYVLLGAGANVLAPDSAFRGVILKFTRLSELFCDGELLYAGAGVTGGSLLRYAKEHEMGGLEAFAGIPMTVGGGTAMNAGISDLHFSDVVESVTAVDEGRLKTFSNADCRFSGKNSLFLSGLAVTQVCFRLRRSTFRAIRERENEYLRKRKDLPKGRSMGCVFVNPNVMPAGMLIERCGCKGLRVGGAYVSDRHANFIINEGGSASDVASLIDLVREKVKSETGIQLREEIRRISIT